MSKFVDAIIGHAVGDAMGVPTEFCIRETLLKHPVTEMISSPKVGQPAGAWSDDTSMEICTIESYIERNKFDYADIMQKWADWINYGKYTANGDVFDVGRTCLSAIKRYTSGVNPTDCGPKTELSNGNGSLMRILPVALYAYSKKLSEKEIVKLTNELSSLTHGHDTSLLGCYIYVKYIIALLQGKTKEEAYELIQKADYSMYDVNSIEKYHRILKENIKDYKINDISSKGYIVDTLECALWIFLNAKNYRETIIASTNIGNDTDTIGAIAGSMAGIVYGINSIPESWLSELKKKEYLIQLALDFEKLITNYRKDVIIGTIIGDISGSRFEILNTNNKEFELLHRGCKYTDDSVMTLAVAKAFIDSKANYSDLEEKVIESMTELGRKYPNCGYGPSFYQWIMSDKHEPYGSYGNGAAMRISAVGVVGKGIKEIKKMSGIITNVSHNHQDSITGSEAVAIAINMALKGKSKEETKEYIEKNYFMIHDLRKDTMKRQEFHINCVETVKQSIGAFLDSYDFEDAIRNAIAIGGDSDTIAAITGGIAAAYYGIPDDIYSKVLVYLDDYLMDIHDKFYKKYQL